MFFFFKQKTAYEVRISDWSSDVCSSDLALRGLQRIARRHQPPQFVEAERIDGIQADRPMPAMRRVEAAAEKAGGDHSRVCQSLRLWTMRSSTIMSSRTIYKNRKAVPAIGHFRMRVPPMAGPIRG